MRKMVSLDEAAETLGTSKRHVRRLIAVGELRAYRVGPDTSRIVRVYEEDVSALLRPIQPNGTL